MEIAKDIKAAKISEQLKKVEPVEINKLTCKSKPTHLCYHWGQQGHNHSTYHFKEELYQKCGKKGHIARVC